MSHDPLARLGEITFSPEDFDPQFGVRRPPDAGLLDTPVLAAHAG